MTLPSTMLNFYPSFARVLGPNPTITGTDLQNLVSNLFSFASGITAATTTALAGAVALTATINEIGTSATTGNAVMLRPALPGDKVTVINDGAQSITVYGNSNNPNNATTTDTIAAHGSTTQAGATTGVTQASGTVAQYVCFATGKWKQFLTA